MADKNAGAELKSMLVLAKTKEMRFAFVKQGSGGKLLMCPKHKKIPKEDIDEAKKGGGTLLTGFCSGPPDDLVFKARVTSDPSPTLGEAIKKAANNLGLGQLIKKALVVKMSKEEVASEGPPDDGATQGAPTEVSAGDGETLTPSQGAGTKVDPKVLTQRLGKLKPTLKEIAAQKGPEAEKINALASSVKSHAAKREYDQAAADLDQLEPLVAQFTKGKEDYKVRRGEVEAAATKIAGWGLDADKYKKAIEAADALAKTNVADALAALDKSKSEAEADAKKAEEEYQALKKSLMPKVEQARDAKTWDHVKVDLEALPKPEDADAKVQEGKGAEGRKILQDLVAP